MFPLLGNLEYDTSPNVVPYTLKLTDKAINITDGFAYLIVSNLGYIMTIGTTGEQKFPDQWMDEQDYTGFGDSFEVRMTETGGTVSPDQEPAADTVWVAITGEMIWSWTNAGTFVGTLDIQPLGGNGTTDILLTCTINVSVAIPWSIADMTLAGTDTIDYVASGSGYASQRGLDIKDDGTVLVGFNTNNRTFYKWTFGTDWDITTLSYVHSIAPGSGASAHGRIAKDGSALYIVHDPSKTIQQYLLSTPWDLTTAGLIDASLDHSTEMTVCQSFCFSDDGTKLYLASLWTEDIIAEYDLSTAWDISTAVHNSATLSTAAIATYENYAMEIGKEGTLLCITNEPDAVITADLSTAWDITSAGAFTVNGVPGLSSARLTGIAFKPDGTKMYLSDDSGFASDYTYEFLIDGS